MTGARIYSAPMVLAEALDEVRLHAGVQFHPDAVAALERLAAGGTLAGLTGEGEHAADGSPRLGAGAGA
jgi:HD-GYP domain-containing protein (c-di-GMP phosphodiesterase class II)